MDLKKIFIPLLLFGYALKAHACCAAFQHRFFPIGSVNNKMVVIEMVLARDCKGGDGGAKSEEIRWRGVINLGYYIGRLDSIEFIANTDTITITECICNPRHKDSLSQYRETIFPYYEKALKQAKSISGFRQAKTVSLEYFKNDSLLPFRFTSDSTIRFINEKTEYEVLPYGNMCGYFTFVEDIKTYRVEKNIITVINFSCNKPPVKEAWIKQNKKYFKKLETAFYRDIATWHDESYDCIIVRPI